MLVSSSRRAARARTTPFVALFVAVAAFLTPVVLSGPAAAEQRGAGNAKQSEPRTQKAPRTPSLGGALDGSGAITVTEGAFDASGYRMVLDEDGSPRFVADEPAEATPSITGNPAWDTRFGQVGASYSYINAVAVSGADIYIGGDFDEIDSASGLTYRNVARWDGRGWQSLGVGARNGTNNTVNAIAISGGDVYVGGTFTSAGGSPASRIAKWNGTAWSPLGSGVNKRAGSYITPSVDALVVGPDGALYAGGEFERAGTVGANSVAKWNGAAWSRLSHGIRNCTYFDTPGHCYDVPDAGQVNAMVMIGGTLYVGGDFNMAGSALLVGLARWNGASWSTIGSVYDTTYSTPDPGYINALATDGANLYIGGEFNKVGTVVANSVAKYNGTTWSALASGVHSCAGCGLAEVTTLGFWNSRLFVGGDFYDAGNRANTKYFAQWTPTGWAAVGTGLENQNARPDALVPTTGGILAAGYFHLAGTSAGNSVLSRLGKWNGTSWTGFGLGVASSQYGGGYVNAIATNGRNAYVGGYLGNAGWSRIGNVAHFNGTGWNSMAGGVNGTVNAIAVQGANVYVGGDFTQAGGIAASRIARWDGTRWWPLGSGVSGSVRALLMYNNKLYVGGDFTNAGGLAADSMAVWTPATSTWKKLGGGATYGYGTVYALAGLPAPNNHYLFIGGSFSELSDSGGYVEVNGLVVFDTALPTPAPLSGYYLADLGSTTPGVTDNGGYAGTVYALATHGTSVFVGGDFDSGGDVASRGIARYSIGAADAGWSSPGVVGGDYPNVNALLTLAGRIYVTGSFETAGNRAANGIASYNVAGNTWSTLGSGLGDPYGPEGQALAQSTDGLYVGGDFAITGTKPAHNLGLYAGTAP